MTIYIKPDGNRFHKQTESKMTRYMTHSLLAYST